MRNQAYTKGSAFRRSSSSFLDCASSRRHRAVVDDLVHRARQIDEIELAVHIFAEAAQSILDSGGQHCLAQPGSVRLWLCATPDRSVAEVAEEIDPAHVRKSCAAVAKSAGDRAAFVV